MKRLLAHLALAIVALTYGGNYLVAKGLMPELVGPSGFIVLRVTGALVLFGLLLLVRPEKVERKDLPRMAFCGLTGVGINMLLFFNGLNATSPVNASLIMTVNPILVLLASAAMLGQPIVRRRLVGVGRVRRGAAGAGAHDRGGAIRACTDIATFCAALSHVVSCQQADLRAAQTARRGQVVVGSRPCVRST